MFYSFLVKSMEYLKIREDKKKQFLWLPGSGRVWLKLPWFLTAGLST